MPSFKIVDRGLRIAIQEISARDVNKYIDAYEILEINGDPSIRFERNRYFLLERKKKESIRDNYR